VRVGSFGSKNQIKYKNFLVSETPFYIYEQGTLISRIITLPINEPLLNYYFILAKT